MRTALALGRRALGLGLAASACLGAAPPRRTLLGTYGGAGCTGLPEVQAFEHWLGHPVDVVLDFLQKDSWSGMVGEASWIAGCWNGLPGRRLALAVPMLVDDGEPDSRRRARAARSMRISGISAATAGGWRLCRRVPRIGWEFNGDWYRWTARTITPRDFIGFWRRIVLAMRAVPGAQFLFDWNPTVADGPLESAYPAMTWSMSSVSTSTTSPGRRSPTPATRWNWLLHQRAGLVWHRQFAAKHGKPRSFPEWGTGTRPDGHGGGDDPMFVRNMLAWMQTGGPVAYACYWNYARPGLQREAQRRLATPRGRGIAGALAERLTRLRRHAARRAPRSPSCIACS